MVAKRRDANHAEVRDTLRRLGCLVLDLGSVGKGCPDLLVAFRGQMVLLEVKDGKKPASARKLTPDEVEFHAEWKGYATVVSSVAEAMKAVGFSTDIAA